jgi:hypothetical protein
VLDGFHLECRLGELPELRWLHVAIAHEDETQLAEVEEYRWELRVTLELTTGELRRAWETGEWDDGDLIDNLPGATLCVPAAQLPAAIVVHVEGSLEIAGEAVVFDQRITPGRTAIVASPTPLAPLPPTPSRPVTPVIRTLSAPGGAYLVATLPDLGIVEYVRPTYRLHTPAGSFALAGLDSVIDGLSGHEMRRSHVGGARGRLAIYSERDHPHVTYVVLVEVYANGAVRVIHRSTTIATEQGWFDPTGTLYLGWSDTTVTQLGPTTTGYSRHTIVFDTDGVQPIADWSAPTLCSDGQRWHVDPEELAILRGSELIRAPRGRPPTSHRVWMSSNQRDEGSSYHPVPELCAWIVADSVHLFHPVRGGMQVDIPGAGAIAVLRDGRVLAAVDNLWLIDPDGTLTDLGQIGYCGNRLVITDSPLTLWTLDPSHWSIAIP